MALAQDPWASSVVISPCSGPLGSLRAHRPLLRTLRLQISYRALLARQRQSVQHAACAHPKCYLWPFIWTQAFKTFERSDFLKTCQHASQNAATRSTGPGRNQKTRSSHDQFSIESSTFFNSSDSCQSFHFRNFQSSSSQAASCQSFHFQASSSWQTLSFSRHHRHHPD